MSDELKSLEEQGTSELAACGDETALRAWNTKFFGDKGLVKAALGKLATIPKDQKAAYGQTVNLLKAKLTTAYDSALAAARRRRSRSASRRTHWT